MPSSTTPIQTTASANDNFHRSVKPLSRHDVRVICAKHARALAPSLQPNGSDGDAISTLTRIIMNSRDILRDIVWRGTCQSFDTVAALPDWDLTETAAIIVTITHNSEATGSQMRRLIVGTIAAALKGRGSDAVLRVKGR